MPHALIQTVRPTGNYDAIIIGAGVAGLVAVHQLVKSGVNPGRLLVVEAQDYIGGRACTVEGIDTGAHWGHGGKANRFFKWAKHNFGDELREAFAVEHFDDIFVHDKLKHASAINAEDSPVESFRSAGYSLCEQRYKALKALQPERDMSAAELALDAGALAGDYVRLSSSVWMGQPPEQTSTDEMFADSAGAGGLQVKGGIGRMIGVMAAKLRRQGVDFVLNAPVAAIIDRGKGYGVLGPTLSASERLYAKNVILTVSAGILQSGSIKLPMAMTEKLQSALAGLQMANLMKIVIPVEPKFFDRSPVKPNTRIDLMNVGDPVFVHARSAGENTIAILGSGSNMQVAIHGDRQQLLEFCFGGIGKNATVRADCRLHRSGQNHADRLAR